MEPLLEARGITKAFAGVVAVDSLDLAILPGEVLALVGENGAGKSTVIKMMSGQYVPDAGELRLLGRPVAFRAPVEARDAGIGVIHQELQLVPQMSVAENVVLGRWPRGGAGVDFDRARKIAAEVLPTIGFHLSVDTLVEALSTGQQQLVEIGRALAFQSKILILDEPTASLSNSEAERLMELVQDLKSRGLGILYVSHRMEEIFRLSDRIAVMRDGKLVGVGQRAELDHDKVVAMMVGDQRSLHVHRGHTRGALLLRTTGLTRRGVFEDISIDVHRGEVVGLAGLVGAGRTDVARCLFGLEPPDAGSIAIDGAAVRIANPQDAISRGFALVPEDRKNRGLILTSPVSENITLTALARLLARLGFVRASEQRRTVDEAVTRFNIRGTDRGKALAHSLSGGNQQKVLIARVAAARPRVLILDQPTAGVDIGAKADIYRHIFALAAEGVACIVVSDELEELLTLADRIAVVRGGRITSTEVAAELRPSRLLELMSQS